MLFVVLSGFVLAVFAPLVHRVAAPVSNWLLALLPAGLTWYFAQFLADNARGEPQRFVDPWAPDLGVSLSFYVDGLSLVFALLICGIGTLIVISAGAYLKGHANLG
ncbi:MAG: Na(+)/H(+) antiporter subunit A, partial [Pseudomonadota bacterium]